MSSHAQSPSPHAHDVTRLLHDVQEGRDGARDALVALVYDELHDLAKRFMRQERGDHTLQPTALVHEAYMRLLSQQDVSWQNRSHFYGVASQAMRRILVDHARRKRAAKRDGGRQVTLDDSLAPAGDGAADAVDVLALDAALAKLAVHAERAARVVELRFFGGLEIEQTAEALGVSPATVKRDWAFARAFLQREMETAEDDDA